MSRRDYIEAARILSETPMPADVHEQLVASFVTMFADDNPRFSPSRFRAACEQKPEPLTAAERRTYVADAEREGYEHGMAAGSWVIDGRTSEETARRILEGIEDGDPEILDSLPSSPLSGEWADGLRPGDVLGWYELDEDDPAAEEILSAFEAGYSNGVQAEVIGSARAIVARYAPCAVFGGYAGTMWRVRDRQTGEYVQTMPAKFAARESAQACADNLNAERGQ